MEWNYAHRYITPTSGTVQIASRKLCWTVAINRHTPGMNDTPCRRGKAKREESEKYPKKRLTD